MRLPILYSFRRCPYAIRARLALTHCGASYAHREVVLKDKPAHMLDVSKKGTVPILVLPTEDNNSTGTAQDSINTAANYRVIDESIDIMHWAMNENQSRHVEKSQEWLVNEKMSLKESNALIKQNDFEFKGYLDKYKYSDRHPEHPQLYYLEQAMPFLEKLEAALSDSRYLGGTRFRFIDAAILPFIRQFSMVQPKQFDDLTLPNLQLWLANGLASDLFLSVMHKIPQWKGESDNELIVLGKQ